ncbi:MAG: carbohydrate-binding protein [Pirellulaceae bacterium]|nr:carbohydrate-binding protein [Pirellulaceae bacterium]
MAIKSTLSLVLVSVLAFTSATADASDFYVAPSGNDVNPGTQAEPFATLQAAVNQLQPGDTLLMRGGVYRETVTFPRSGADGRPITLKPYHGEQVIVSGCDQVAGWTRHGDNIWKAAMDWTLGLGRNQVFVGDEVMIEARYPNTPAPGLEMYVSDLSPLWPTFGEFSIPQETRADQPGRIMSKLLEGQPDDYWTGALYYGVHFEGWCAQTGVIESSTSGEILVGDRTQGWWFGSAYGGKYSHEYEEGRGMIVGHMNALDQPGEWHWQHGELYLIPRDGREPAGIRAKRRQLAFDLSGREHIRIEGLYVLAASALLEDASFCIFDDCHFSYIAHYLRHYGIGQIERGRDTIKSGETGIFVGGHDNAFLNCSVRCSAGTGFHLRGYHHTIHNCLIDEVSYTAHYLNAITDAVSDFANYENMLVGGHVITFNTMRNAGRHFFNINGNGTNKASRDRGSMDYAATLLAHNHLYNGMLQTRDAGFLSGYYCSGGTLHGQHSQFLYNVLHDCYDIFGMRINKLGLVYLDAGTCHVDLHHNLLWASPGSHQRGMWFNTCCVGIRERDNVFHQEFLRDSGSLKPEDFPEGRPFRFGHDFQCPPDLPHWPQLVRQRLEVEQCDSQSAGEARTPAGVSGVKDGDWFAFDAVDFNQGWQSAVLRLASGQQAMNTDRSARVTPRHQKATDPLVLEAEYNDGIQDKLRKQWTFLYNIQDNTWVRFNQVPLGEGYHRFRAVYGNDSAAPWRLEVHLDRPDGPLVGQVNLTQTDRYRGNHVQIYDEAVGGISLTATGTHDVFLVFRTDGAKPAVNFEYLRFEQSRGELPLQKNEVKLELRAGSKDGPKIGMFYPRVTGGSDRLREFVATLEPVSGTQPLFLVVRSALDGPIGMIDWLSLEKGVASLDESGWGVPPLQDAAGGWLLPQPTHRPCFRPNDEYVRRQAEKRAAPPLHAAIRLQHPPSIDGQLSEWTDSPRILQLRENMDGAVSPLPASRAWVAYDDQAMYIAARHPADDTSVLRESSRLWGQTAGMELAIQPESATAAPMLNLRGFTDGHLVCAETEGVSAAFLTKLHEAVTYRTRIDADGWSCEWRIPFAAAGFTPIAAPQVRFNLGVRPGEDSWLYWSGTGGSIRQLALGGMLIFPAEFTKTFTVPTDGLAVWLDASDADSVTRDADGGVSLWKDKSGGSHHARQDQPAHRPRYATTGLNGKPSLQFHERNATRLELPDLADSPISATIFAVISNPTPGDPRNHDPRIFTASDGQGYDYQVGLCLTVPGMETGGPRQTVAMFKDRGAKVVRVGCFSPNYQTYFTGDIGEILVYSRLLTAQEMNHVRTYLMSKWDL